MFVVNKDRFRHTLVIKDEVDAVELPASTDVRIPIDLDPGKYEYYCDVPGHESMKGIVVVEK